MSRHGADKRDIRAEAEIQCPRCKALPCAPCFGNSVPGRPSACHSERRSANQERRRLAGIAGPIETKKKAFSVDYPQRQPFHGNPGNTKQIGMFFVCRRCMDNGIQTNLEAGWTTYGVQLWCRNHDMNLIHIDFMNYQHPADTSSIKSQPPSCMAQTEKIQ